MRFVYSVVRFVPHPARGEFINVAAIVGSEALGVWKSRRVGNAHRAQRSMSTTPSLRCGTFLPMWMPRFMHRKPAR